MKNNANWTPLYFLAALGSGGMVVTFFMYLLFWVPHPGRPITVYNDWIAHIQAVGTFKQAVIGMALAGILVFAFFHFKWLFMNFKQYARFKAEGKLEKLKGTNAHSQLMALPLTCAMSMNAGFIVAAIFIPDLWDVIEMIFPFSIAIFLLLGIWASRIYLSFFSNILQHGSFDNTANNSYAQLLPSFAFAMIGVGLAAPAAMSHNDIIIGISYLLSLFFITGSVFIGMIKMVIGMNDMFKHGASLSTLPTLWIGIPILTTVGIAIMRLSHGLHTMELGHGASNYILLVIIFSLQIIFWLMGTAVMKRMQFFQAIRTGEVGAPMTFALICPGVALIVTGHFILNKVIVASGIIPKYGAVYICLASALIIVQFITGFALAKFVRAS